MSHVHKRFSDEQVKVLLQGYCQGQLRRSELQELWTSPEKVDMEISRVVYNTTLGGA
jgi:hypothetical protein